jgi:8-oxo-dGTP pyrophosphatase MutT (NUDIX family)
VVTPAPSPSPEGASAGRYDDVAYRSWVDAQRDGGAPVVLAATVILLRDTDDGLEVLMLRRNTAVVFVGGFWVFPGGRLDPIDHELAASGSDGDAGTLMAAARHAAAREALEEAQQVVDSTSLVWFAHWTPPSLAPKRFATFFFACRALGHAVTIDGSEIHDSAWVQPEQMLARHRATEVDLAPPTWVTLQRLAPFATVDDALTALALDPPDVYETHIMRSDDVMVAVWEGDAAHGGTELDIDGPRHRLVMRPGAWTFVQHS